MERFENREQAEEYCKENSVEEDDISCGCGCFDYQWQTLEYYILGNKVMLNFTHYNNGNLTTDVETIGQID
jgi:hypothetical protein